MMEYFNAILHDEEFEAALATLNTLEETRIFCKHGIDHLFDVARVSWILAVENQRAFDKESLYLAALLHDIGRCQTVHSHDKESVVMARHLLTKHRVPVEKQEEILSAIGKHREKSTSTDLSSCSLGELLAYADQRTRLCFACPAAHACYWSDERKNHSMNY